MAYHTILSKYTEFHYSILHHYRQWIFYFHSSSAMKEFYQLHSPRFFTNGVGLLPRRVGLFTDADYDSVLQECTNIQTLNQVHAHNVINGFQQKIFLQAKLVTLYATVNIEHACLLFDKIHRPKVYLWNVMIREYSMNGFCFEALALYC